jgi:uncharacterized membrane-anchored protein
MKAVSALLALLLVSIPSWAEDPATPAAAAQPASAPGDAAGAHDAEQAAIATFEASLAFQNGSVALPGGFATLNLSNNFRFLGADDARRVLVEAWGNPPESAKGVLGMVFPADVGPASHDGWGVVITYEKDGYVKDTDAESIDYDKLLKDMQEGAAEENEERRKNGYPTVQIHGWAERPYYDKAAHKMYWARELRFNDSSDATLNYDIRVLGRYGVLSLNAVAGIGQLAKVKQDMREVLSFTDFDQGHRYAEFNDSTDKVAAYGLAALVAGGVAAKMGMFAKIGILLLSFKKVLILAVAGVGAVLVKVFKGRRSES